MPDTVADNVSDISSFSDSSDEAKKVVEVVEEAIEESDKPAYSEEDLETLVGFIRNMIFLFDYDEDDFSDEVAEIIKVWLTDVNYPLLFIFYDGDILSASLAFPLCPFNDLMYFMREPDQLFNIIERFHDDIMFGTLHSDIEGSLLVLLEQVYGPLILSNSEWSENVKAHVLTGYNTFMTYLTELHYKLSGFTLLYVPREGNDMDVHEVVLNRSMIKRLEAVVIDWTSQIRSSLSDTQHFVPDDLICPSDEYNFWIYRHEVLSAIKTQFEGTNIQHILKILDLAQSLYTKPLREVLTDLVREIETAESNIPFLKLLVDPCFAIRTLDNEDDLCSQLVYVMHIIRFIGQDSTHLQRDDCITKLFLYLSNEIVSCCMQSIDIDKILSGSPNYGIEICNLKINCCESYKIIYEEMLEHFKTDFTWNLDYAAIFNRINAFMQRLCDILDVCEAMLIFGRYSGSNSYKNYRFSCNNAEDYEQKCEQVQIIFAAGIETIQSTSGSILDINNKDWYKYVADFREMLKNLDDIIENLLSNIFLVAENLEEKIDVLITLLNFYKRDSIKESFMRKIAEVWNIYQAELTALSKHVSSGINSYPTILPKRSGQYTSLKIKFERICRLKYLLERCRFFPQYKESEEILSLFELCEKQVNIALKGFNDAWNKSISTDFGSWFHRNLISRSQIRPGLLECHIERRMLLIIDEAYFFKVLGSGIPNVIDMEKNDSIRQTFDGVIRVVLYFNNVVSSISEKERLFFKPMIQQTERKLEPLRSKLTWDEDLSEFIDTFVVNVKELLDVIQVYKRENFKISRWMENIYNLLLFQLNKTQAQQLGDFIKTISEQKKISLSELVRVYSEISKNIFCIFEHLGSNLRKMGESWAQYVQKIDRLLKAAIFNSSLDTLENIQRALTEASSPILSIEIVLDKRGIAYQPTLESIETTLKRLPVEVTSTIKIIPSMCQRFQIDTDDQFYDDFVHNAAYLEFDKNIDEAIVHTIKDLTNFKEKWNVFRPFWSVNRIAFIEQFKLSSMTSEAFQKNIEKFDELLNQLTTQNDLTICKCIEVDALKLKYAITSHINDWQIKYIEYLKCVSYGQIIEFNKRLNTDIEALSNEPKEVQDLKNLESTFEICSNAIPDMIEQIQIITKYFDVLEKYVSDLLPEASNLRQNIHSIWQRYMDYLNHIKEQIENYQNQFKLSMANGVACLKVNALEMLKMLDDDMPTSDQLLPEEAFSVIATLFAQLDQLEAQEQVIKENMNLLEVEYHPLDVIIEIRRKLENMKLMWLFVEERLHVKKTTFQQEYANILNDEIHEHAEFILGKFHKLASTINEDIGYPILSSTSEEVQNFKIIVSIITNMKSSHLRDRHWTAIQELTKTEFNQNESFVVGSLVDYHFYHFVENIMKLCYAARKEYEIEMELVAIEKEAQQVRYNIKRPEGEIYRILDSEACFSILKANIVKINRLQPSPHCHPFQSTINYWEETLHFMSDLLDVLLLIEDRSNMLYEIFKITEMSEQFREFNNSFKFSFGEWCHLMHFISQASLREEICPGGPGLLQDAETLRKRFDDIFQKLKDIMDLKRNSYFRFYLVPDMLLIKLIAYPTNFELLQQVMAYTFENIKVLSFRRLELPQKHNRWEISGVRTKTNENIAFVKNIVIDTTMNADYIMAQVEQSICDSLKSCLKKCLFQLKRNYFKRIACGWMQSWNQQVCLKSTHIENTLHIRNALLQSELLGRTKPLKMLRTMHNKLLNELTTSAKQLHETSDDSWLKKKIDDIIIMEINVRDVIHNLVTSNASGLKNFEWLSQVRSYWNEDTCTCSVAHINSIFHYGYESKPANEPIFMTPHTNRSIMAITSAIKHRLVPYLTGDEENIGASLLKQLSTELAVFFVILNCDYDSKLENIIRHVNGIVKLQSWLCFDGIEKLPSQTIAKINEKIKVSLAVHTKYEVLDLKKTKLYTKVQFFAITCDQSQAVTELERSIMRPVSAIFPDQDVVLQNLLCFCGVQQYRKIARLLDLSMQHIKESLPNQLPLWTFNRMRKAVLRIANFSQTFSFSDGQLMVMALQDEFSPSLSETEKIIFERCVFTVFEITPNEDHSQLLQEMTEEMKQALCMLKLTATKYLEMKVKEVLQILASDRPLIISGEPCSGKSKFLELAMLMLSNKTDNYKQYHINPDSLESATKNGPFSFETIDEIVTAILESTEDTRKCLIFDGELQDSWVKRVNFVQDYNRNYLAKVSRSNVDLKIVIETTDLRFASPAALADFDIVHFGSKQTTWHELFNSWLTYEISLEVSDMHALQDLSDKYLELFFEFFKTCAASNSYYVEKSIIRTFCHLYKSLFDKWTEDKLLVKETNREEVLTKLFFFCCIWSIGGILNQTERAKFDVLIREQIADSVSSFPLKGNVFQYFIEINENSSEWIFWNESHLGLSSNKANLRQYVYNIENVSYLYVTATLMTDARPVIICSDGTVGKTTMIKQILTSQEKDNQTTCFSTLSSNTSPEILKRIISHHTMKVSKEIVYPRNRKNLVWFLDDLHSVLDTKIKTTEFLRHLIEHNVWYETHRPHQLKQTSIIAAMRNTVALHPRSPCNARLLNKFHIINYNPCNEENTASIFGGKIRAALSVDSSNKLLDLLAPATVDFVRCLAKRLPPIPRKPRYQFSLKTIGRILSAFCTLSINTNLSDKNSVLRLWIHECYRETWDLLDNVDYKKFYEILNDNISRYFEVTLHGLCPANKSPLFCDVLHHDSVYEDVKEIHKIIQYTETASSYLNPYSTLVVHQEAIEHAAKVFRILRLETGHMILVGEAGSGRNTVCQLASIISNFNTSSMTTSGVSNTMKKLSLHILDIRANDSAEVVDRKLSELFECCSKNQTLCLIAADQRDTINDNALEILNSFIVNGTVGGLYPCSSTAQEFMTTPTWEKIKRNLHLIICAPVDNELYRHLFNMYPSLLTSITTNCMHSLSEKSSTEISQKFMKNHVIFNVPILAEEKNTTSLQSTQHRKRESLVQSTEERLYHAASEVIPRIHSAAKYEMTNFSPSSTVLCSWYFELLFTFKRVFYSKRHSLSVLYNKFHTGIARIAEATYNVELLQEQLEKQQEQIAIYQTELQDFIENIQTQTEEADEQSQEVAIKREKIGAEEIICKQLAAVAEVDLEKAMPALNSAIAALDSLNKKDMNEIKSYSRPPVKVELVLNAVMIMLGKEPSWAEAKRQLGEQKFLDTLRNFDRNNITEKTLKTIGGYARNPELEPNKVGVVSKAAKSLMLWVKAIENYGKVYKYVGPKIKKVEEAKASLLEKQNSLLAAERKLAELAERLATLRMEYENKIKCKEELEEAARQMTIKLERSKSLVNGLGNEKIRWSKTAKNLEMEYSHLIGDAMLAAGSLVYFGSLPSSVRASLKAQWKVDLETLEVPFTETCSLLTFLYESEELQSWQNYGLPDDDLSLENAAILLNNRTRIPVAIDSQGEIHRWIIKLHSTSGILQRDFTDDIPEDLITTALREQTPLLIHNLQNRNMHNFHDLQTIYFRVHFESCEHKRKQRLTDETTQEDAENPTLFLVSTESIPFDSPIKKVTNMVNFILGLPGLEEKLLAIVVEYENPALEERKEQLKRTIISNEKTLIDLEENILQILNESKVPLLENEELYTTLQTSRHTSESINTALGHSEYARQDIENSREIYRPCAARASLLFFVVDDMRQFSPFYWFSLDWYIYLFKKSLEKSGRSQVIEERKIRIIDYHTTNIFRNVCFALTELDKKIFGFFLSVRLLFANEKMSKREFSFLLHGAGKIDRLEQIENPYSDWITSEHWDNITELDKLPGFRGITQSFEEAASDWKQWYMSPYPEVEKLPENWERNLTKFQKYMVVRSVRLDRFEPCVNDFIEWNLGKKYSNFNRSSLRDVLHESSARTPILLISSPHSNPWQEVQNLAKSIEGSSDEKLQYLNMGVESIESVVNYLKTCVQGEKWLYLQDCHKSNPFLSKLNHIVTFITSVDQNSNFRLWMNTDVNAKHFPIHALQKCMKFMYNEPIGIKQKMSSLYEEIGEDQFNKIKKTKNHTQHRKLLFSLAFFHSLLIERNKFQKLGWTNLHFFNSLDFHLAEKILAFSMKELMSSNHGRSIGDQRNLMVENEDGSDEGLDIVPWNFIINVSLEVGYGTQFTNKWDRRLFDTYSKEIFRRQIINKPQCPLVLDVVSYQLPRDGNYQSYINYITKEFPHADGTIVFGQNENANIKYLESQSAYMLQMLRKVHIGPPEADTLDGRGGATMDYENVKQTLLELLTTLPVCLDYDNAARIVGANRTPVSDSLLNEISTYNQITELARRNLEQTIRVLSGEQSMSDPHHKFLAQVERNQVPQAWKRYPTNKCLSDWIIDLKERVAYFQRWAETGQLSTDIILGRFIRPKLFMNSVLKIYAKSHNVPVSELKWDVSVFSTMKPITRVPITEGFVARGMHLENGGWDLERQCLKQPRILEINIPMPPIAFKPVQRSSLFAKDKTYLCPCYYNNHRNEETFIFSLYLKPGDFSEETWIKYSTALLLTT